MARQPLTGRQKEILALVREEKSPEEIAKKLKVTTNAVYAHISRIRERGHLAQRAGRKRTRTRATTRGRSRPAARRTTRRAPRVTSRSNNAVPTPLQALSIRRSQIEGAMKQADAEHDAAERAAEKSREALRILERRFGAELEGITTAEEALRAVNNRPGRRPRQQARATGSRRRGQQRKTARKRGRARKPQATEVAA